MYFILLVFVWHTGAAVVGDEACALLFLCPMWCSSGGTTTTSTSSSSSFSIFVFGVRAREVGGGYRAL